MFRKCGTLFLERVKSSFPMWRANQIWDKHAQFPEMLSPNKYKPNLTSHKLLNNPPSPTLLGYLYRPYEKRDRKAKDWSQEERLTPFVTTGFLQCTEWGYLDVCAQKSHGEEQESTGVCSFAGDAERPCCRTGTGQQMWLHTACRLQAEHPSHGLQTGRSGQISPEGGKITHAMKVGQTYNSPPPPTTKPWSLLCTRRAERSAENNTDQSVLLTAATRLPPGKKNNLDYILPQTPMVQRGN